MPGFLINGSLFSVGASPVRFSVFSLPLIALLAACNGQTPFVEQSRILDAEVQIASADADALPKGQRGINRELPTVRDGEQTDGVFTPDPSWGRAGRSVGEVGRGGLEPSNGRVDSGAEADAELNRPGRSPNETRNSPPDLQVPMPDADPPNSGNAPTQGGVVDAGTSPSQGGTSDSDTPVPPAQSQEPRPGGIVHVELVQPRAKVDILWVVDNSGSMAWAQNQLKSKFQAFARKLQDTRIDFQVGVTSLDVCSVNERNGYPVSDALCPNRQYIADAAIVANEVVGPLRGSLQVDRQTNRSILRDTSDFVQAFQRTALLGTQGSAFEHGLWAARLAVEKSLASDGSNSGFVRKDATLSVIVLSDEEDDSVQMWCEDGYGRTSLDTRGQKDLSLCRDGGRSPYLDAFGIAPYALMQDSKGRPLTTHKYTAEDFKAWVSRPAVKGAGNVRVSAITGLRGASGQIDCSRASDGPEESGTNYIRAAQLTGGAIENICSPDWSSVLSNVGQSTVELATKVSLPRDQIPFPGTLRVSIDGQEVAQRDYSYDPMLHAVVFKTPPPMGAVVSVSFNETLVD